MKCFTFTIENLQKIRKLLDMYIDVNPDFSKYPPIDNAKYSVTIKAPQLYEGILNPDAVIDFHRCADGYNAHFSNANALLLDVEGMQKPFDFHITTKGVGIGKFTTQCTSDSPNPLDNPKLFLQATYKFGVKQSNETVFVTAMGCAQFTSMILKFIYDIRESGENTYYKLRPDYYELGEKVINALKWNKRKETLLDGWDVVNLTEKQYYKVIDTLAEHHYEYDIQNIPLPRFCLALYDGEKTLHYFFERKGNDLLCGITDPQNFLTKNYTIKLGDTAFGNNAVNASLVEEGIEPDLMTFLKQKTEGNEDENWGWQANTFFIINAFMLHFGDVTMEVETKQAVARSEQKSRKHHHRNTVRMFKTYKLVRNWKTQARKKAEITCPCWGVRGHFRHYKNGKTIFIEPFMKGKERDKYTGKEYNLLPYKDA